MISSGYFFWMLESLRALIIVTLLVKKAVLVLVSWVYDRKSLAWTAGLPTNISESAGATLVQCDK